MSGRKGAIALALMALTAAGCGGKDKKADAELKGTVALGVLAPVADTRGKDLTDGATLAAEEVNRGGGVLGHKLELNVIDDACMPLVAYEAAKSFVSDPGSVTGVIGGMCDAAAEREIPVVDSTGLPFLVTGATSDKLVSDELTGTYFMNGTVYQQALSATYWMKYRQAQRLAVVQDDTPESKDLARQAIGLLDQPPKLVSLQTVEPGGQDIDTIAKAAVASKPDFVYWTGGAAAGGQLVKALRAAGYKGTFSASSASEAPEFLSAAGPAGEDAFVIATASPTNTQTPAAEQWRARFERRYRRAPSFDAQQGYDSVRALAHAIGKSRSTEPAKMLAALTTLDMGFTNSLGAVRFARDHRLLYDNRVILKVSKGAFTWERSLRTDSLG